MIEILPYASRTGTRKNLAGLRARGWRLLVSATGVHRTEGFDNYAIDNGAWTAFQKKCAFDSRSFIRLVIALGALADWVATPDIVGGGLDSLNLSLKWLPWVLRHTKRALIPVQDGMVEDDVRDLLSDRVGIFIGGSTPWKLSSMARWCRLAKEKNVWCHVGRVNSMQRIKRCQMAGATPFDGTNATRFSKNQSKLTWAVRQRTLNLEEPK